MGSLTSVLKIVDPLVIVATALASYQLRFGDLDLPLNYQALVLAAFALSVLVFAVTDVYRGRPDESLGRNLMHLFGAWVGTTGRYSSGFVVLALLGVIGAALAAWRYETRR